MDVAHPSNYGQARMWLNCDLTMCQYAGARASSIVPKGTAGTGVLETVGGRSPSVSTIKVRVPYNTHAF
jgi:hypothetical protein